MPLQRDRCSECNAESVTCPECGSNVVTPRENRYQPDPNDVIDFGDKQAVTYTHVCWDCGWDETVTMIVKRE